ncbi:hypothetical protein PTMSG1_09327 [Pyrenophora teres f. maculata]|nr:hypothetical protein PTMSG1_09327 [Pyrenophora teres f. maculata]
MSIKSDYAMHFIGESGQHHYIEDVNLTGDTVQVKISPLLHPNINDINTTLTLATLYLLGYYPKDEKF